MQINQLEYIKKANKKKRRVARGTGSDRGKTAGRGHKGQKSRSGVAIKGFEGGQTPIYRRLPKRGFNNFNQKTYHIVNLKQIQDKIEAGKINKTQTIGIDALLSAGIIRNKAKNVRILANGEIKHKVNIEAHYCSEAARLKVEKLKGKIVIITKETKPKSENKEQKKQTKPQTQQTKAQAKPQTKAQAKPQTKPQVKAQTKPQVKAQTKPQTKPQAKPQTKKLQDDKKTTVKSENKTQNKTKDQDKK